MEKTLSTVNDIYVTKLPRHAKSCICCCAATNVAEGSVSRSAKDRAIMRLECWRSIALDDTAADEVDQMRMDRARRGAP